LIDFFRIEMAAKVHDDMEAIVRARNAHCHQLRILHHIRMSGGVFQFEQQFGPGSKKSLQGRGLSLDDRDSRNDQKRASGRPSLLQKKSSGGPAGNRRSDGGADGQSPRGSGELEGRKSSIAQRRSSDPQGPQLPGTATWLDDNDTTPEEDQRRSSSLNSVEERQSIYRNSTNNMLHATHSPLSDLEIAPDDETRYASKGDSRTDAVGGSWFSMPDMDNIWLKLLLLYAVAGVTYLLFFQTDSIWAITIFIAIIINKCCIIITLIIH